MQHVIGKQVIEVSLQGSKDAFVLQQTLSRVFRDEVAPAMETLFDRLFSEDELVRIDKLEINLGALTEQQIASGAWLPKLLDDLEEAMKTAIREKTPGVQVLPLRSGRFEQWLHFLQHGNLPRHISPPPEQEWQQQILETLGVDAMAVVQLQRLLNNSPVALQRLALQYPGSFLQHVTELFTGHNAATLHAALIELKNAWKAIVYAAVSVQRRRVTGPEAEAALTAWFTSAIGEKKTPLSSSELKQILSRYQGQAGRAIEVECWKIIFSELAKTAAKLRPDDLLRLVFKQDVLKKIQPAIAIVAFEKKAKYPGLKAFFEREGVRPIKKVLDRKTAKPASPAGPDENNPPSPMPGDTPGKIPEAKTPGALIEKNKAPNADWATGEAPAPALPKAPEFPKALPVKEEEPLPPGEDGWHISTAGLVLLHPFLTSLFGELGLLKDREFDGAWSQDKAVMLLHFLATGETTAPEYELTLPKLLCAVPFNRPLDHEMQLTEEEKSEAEELLRAVLAHWGALGKTTPDGLRGNYLVRDGKLLKTESGWRLQVERKTLDILLDRLPWGIGLVKLPWMEELLMVEWN